MVRTALRHAVIAVLLAASPATAQSRIYVGGAGILSSLPEGNETAAPDTPHPGISGNSLGIAATVGVFVSPRVSLAVEISVPARLDVVQGMSYGGISGEWNNRHRDLILSGVVHFHLAPERAVSGEAVAGLSLVNEQTLRSFSAQVSADFTAPIVYGPYGQETELSRTTLGFILGGDVPVRLGPHVSFVPGLRVHVISRETDPNAPGYSLHLGMLAWRGAAGLRVRF